MDNGVGSILTARRSVRDMAALPNRALPQESIGRAAWANPASPQDNPDKGGNCEIQSERCTLIWGTAKVKLPAQRFSVLECLANRAGNLVTHERLQSLIDPNGRLRDAYRQVMVHISTIRRALKDAGIPASITLVEKKGYILNATFEFVSSRPPLVLDYQGVRIFRRLIEGCSNDRLAQEARLLLVDAHA